MYTLLIEQAHALPDDRRIERALQLQAGWPSGTCRECRVGIAGIDGKVYRSVVARGVGELAAIEKLLRGFGLVEGPAEDIFQAVYCRKSEIDRVDASATRDPRRVAGVSSATP